MACALPKNPEIDRMFREAELWRREANALRNVLRDSDLAEELKWGKPCYTHDGRNICIMQRMKGFLALLFFKGALLSNPDGVLEAQGPNSRAACRIRFTSVQDVASLKNTVLGWIREAIELEKAGAKLEPAADLKYPDELIDKFRTDAALKAAFEKLTPGRRRGYVLYFSGARQSQTRERRIEKYRNNILDGKGIHER
jgi:uncharacterized protein YdeI (YjbR/CyaY-like superfamily)